ncbi:hypothetical protein GCM10009525_54910 [Streptosporangium amethystogenes subsp. fukuiense]
MRECPPGLERALALRAHEQAGPHGSFPLFGVLLKDRKRYAAHTCGGGGTGPQMPAPQAPADVSTVFLSAASAPRGPADDMTSGAYLGV